jgi:hypothetical protein
LLFGALVVAAIAWGVVAAAKRRKELAAWAAQKGLSFDPANRGGFAEGLGFPEFEKGENRYAYNLCEGKWADGRAVSCFDYHYETYSTDKDGKRETHHHHFSAVLVNSELPLKPLAIRPEGLFDRVAEFFGADDIDFESAEFSRKFHISSPDRRWAFDVIHTRAMAFLLDHSGWSLQMSGSLVAVFQSGRVLGAAEFEQAVAVATGLLDLFPPYLREQLSAGTAS